MSEHDNVDDLLERIRADRMAASPGDVEALVEAMVRAYGDTGDAARLRATHALLDDYEARVQELAHLRRALIRDLINEGWSQTDIAAMLGITCSRISILARKDDPN